MAGFGMVGGGVALLGSGGGVGGAAIHNLA